LTFDDAIFLFILPLHYPAPFEKDLFSLPWRRSLFIALDIPPPTTTLIKKQLLPIFPFQSLIAMVHLFLNPKRKHSLMYFRLRQTQSEKQHSLRLKLLRLAEVEKETIGSRFVIAIRGRVQPSGKLPAKRFPPMILIPFPPIELDSYPPLNYRLSQ